MKTILYYKDEEKNSDKIYEIWIENDSSKFSVNFAYGRRGNELKQGTKTPEPVEYQQAFYIYNKMIDAKLKKGYTYY